MNRTLGVSVLAGILAALSAREARSEGPSCSRVAVEADASIEMRWPELAGRVRDAFEAREDVDRCARITLTLREGSVGVEVSVPDGRSAHRSVSRREDVLPALEALLILPEAPLTRAEPSSRATTETTAPSTASAATPDRAESAASTLAPVPAREAPLSTPAQPSTHLGIELSVLTGGRIGDGQAGVGFGVLSFLDLSGWLVGFAGRIDRYEQLGGGHSPGALELALLGGRRLRFGTMALDLVAGPAVALGGQSTEETQAVSQQASQPPSQGMIQSASNTVPRLLVEARLSFAARSTLHPFVAVDGDFGPARSPDSSDLQGAPPLPTCTAGLALGATVGTQ